MAFHRSNESSNTSEPSIRGSRSCVGISSCTQTMNVKIGGLWKRSQGVSRFTKPNYKHRVFILTDQALSYYGGTIDRVGQLKGRVPLDTVRAVEFVDMSAFNLAHSLQVVYHSKKNGFLTLYIIATTKEESADWVATLRQACYFNRDMLMHYHPGALAKNKWTCCKQRGRTTLGCQPTYHLLTRSSSRYAQMRRKDTLTNSLNSKDRPRVRSRGSHTHADRRSIATTAVKSTNGEGIPDNNTVVGPPGQGLSNSCMELTIHPPYTQEEVLGVSLQATTLDSRRSSRNSTEPSVGIESMFLNQVSLSEHTGSEEEEEEEEEEKTCRGNGISKFSFRSERGGSRSQVAPEWTTNSYSHGGEFPSRNSYEVVHKTLPRSFKSVSQSFSKSDTEQKSHGVEQSNPVCEEDPAFIVPSPVPPPRSKRWHGGYNSPYNRMATPLTSPPTSPLCLATVAGKTRIKHSKTFVVQTESVQCRNKMQSRACGFSRSMGALSRPLIQPRISHSNPNVIHV